MADSDDAVALLDVEVAGGSSEGSERVARDGTASAGGSLGASAAADAGGVAADGGTIVDRHDGGGSDVAAASSSASRGGKKKQYVKLTAARRELLRNELDKQSGLLLCSGAWLVVAGVLSLVVALAGSDEGLVWPPLALSPVYVLAGVVMVWASWRQSPRASCIGLAAIGVTLLLHYVLSFAAALAGDRPFVDVYTRLCGVFVVFGGTWCSSMFAVSLFMLPPMACCGCCVFRAFRMHEATTTAARAVRTAAAGRARRRQQRQQHAAGA